MVGQLAQGNTSLSLTLFSFLPAVFKLPFKNKLIEMATFEHTQEIIVKDSYGVRDYIKPGDVVIDAGANVGVFSNFAAKQGATVYAFEPGRVAYEILKEDREASVVPVNMGLGSRHFIAELKIADGRLTTATLADSGIAPHEGCKSETVEITTIDDFARDKKLSRLNYIKIDTEGYEANILRGAAETIKKHRPIIVMSSYHKPSDKTELPMILNGITPYGVELNGENFICKPI